MAVILDKKYYSNCNAGNLIAISGTIDNLIRAKLIHINGITCSLIFGSWGQCADERDNYSNHIWANIGFKPWFKELNNIRKSQQWKIQPPNKKLKTNTWNTRHLTKLAMEIWDIVEQNFICIKIDNGSYGWHVPSLLDTCSFLTNQCSGFELIGMVI